MTKSSQNAEREVEKFKQAVLDIRPRSFLNRLFCCCAKSKVDTLKLANGNEVINACNSIGRKLEHAKRVIPLLQGQEDGQIKQQMNAEKESSRRTLEYLPIKINQTITQAEQILIQLEINPESIKLEAQITRLKNTVIQYLPNIKEALNAIDMGIDTESYDEIFNRLRGLDAYQYYKIN